MPGAFKTWRRAAVASRRGELACGMIAVLVVTSGLGPAVAQSGPAIGDKPPAAAPAPGDGRRAGDPDARAKTGKPSDVPQSKRRPDPMPQPGCPAIGDKLELLV
jgi:hypothetical protein